MAILFNQEKHRKLWLLMRDNIMSYMSGRSIPTFYDAEVTVDDLKALQFKNENMGKEFKDGTRKAPLFYCYACQYAWDVLRGKDKLAERRDRCLYCPLEGWGADKCFVKNQIGTGDEGLFHELCQSVEDNDANKAYLLCEQIANLKVRQDVEVGDDEGGSPGEGEDTPIDAEVITLESDETYTMNRENASKRMPTTVLVKTARGFTRSDDIINVAYDDDTAVILNDSDETAQFIIVDSDTQVYDAAEISTLAPGEKIQRSRANNLGTIPVTVLVQDNFSNKDTLKYIDSSPYFTVANTEEGYTIKNELDEPVSYMILQNNKIASRSTDIILSGSSKALSLSKGLEKNLPTVLIKDLDSNSENYNMWIPSVGLLDIVINVDEKTMIIHNDTPEDANIMILEPND